MGIHISSRNRRLVLGPELGIWPLNRLALVPLEGVHLLQRFDDRLPDGG
jgi:hypothetical protein